MDEVKPPGRAARIAAATGLLASVKRKAKTERHAERPAVVFPNERSRALNGLAMELATGGREDAEAVRALRAAAGRRPKDLATGAAMLRSVVPVSEHRIVHRANRLLLAAAADAPVVAATPDQEAFFDRVEALEQLAPDDALALLSTLQPALVEFRATIAEARGVGEIDDDRTRALWLQISRGLAPLVGPKAEVTDPLARTRLAADLARIWIGRSLGLRTSDD